MTRIGLMQGRAASIIPLILAHEGGFVNHPSDPGGATNRGVTLETFRTFIKPKGTIADLRRLTEEQAAIVFKRRYWDEVLADSLPVGVDYAVADFAVNSGPRRAAKYLQGIVGSAKDGRVGPRTLAAVASQDPEWVVRTICARRLAFMKRIGDGQLWSVFGKGWERRVNDVRDTALTHIAQDCTPQVA